MKLRKIVFVLGLMAIFTMLTPGSQVWAGPEDPPTTGTIVGPELWGVVVLDCSSETVVTLRVKRIVGCNVETQAVVQDWTGCPSDEKDPLYWKFYVTLFDINPNYNTLTPIITKVKNFKQDPVLPHVFSFDVQIKFWQHSP